jgi:hypothetical protein
MLPGLYITKIDIYIKTIIKIVFKLNNYVYDVYDLYTNYFFLKLLLFWALPLEPANFS